MIDFQTEFITSDYSGTLTAFGIDRRGRRTSATTSRCSGHVRHGLLHSMGLRGHGVRKVTHTDRRTAGATDGRTTASSWQRMKFPMFQAACGRSATFPAPVPAIGRSAWSGRPPATSRKGE